METLHLTETTRIHDLRNAAGTVAMRFDPPLLLPAGTYDMEFDKGLLYLHGRLGFLEAKEIIKLVTEPPHYSSLEMNMETWRDRPPLL